jgi:gamma-glutamylcyclotransferase (GGCT)/AIG2-like uncharacterized protein YtfP
MMLPFFVYGTLLPQQTNFSLWEDAIERITPATLANATLYSMGHFPMMVEKAGETVWGAVVEIQTERYRAILAAIDRLEGFVPVDPAGSLYQRKAVYVRTQDANELLAWTYFGDQFRTRDRPAIGGDWVTFSADNRPAIDNWWRLKRGETAHF